MDFEFSKKHIEFKKGAIRFAQQALNDGMSERNSDGFFSRKLWRKYADYGFQGAAPKNAGVMVIS